MVAHQDEDGIVKMIAGLEPFQPTSQIVVSRTDQIVTVVRNLAVETEKEFRAVLVHSIKMADVVEHHLWVKGYLKGQDWGDEVIKG